MVTPVPHPDDPLLALDAPDEPAGALEAPPWRVLIVDDDDDVHVATGLAMRGLTIEGRPLAFGHARSAAEAYAMLAADAGICAVLLDVVMETPDAGLRLVQRLRLELGRAALRIILRTGQPGYAPEIETLRDYDINDCRTKVELTRVRLYSCLAVAIRSYAQLTRTFAQRDELARLNSELAEARAAERAETERRLAAENELRRTQERAQQCVEQRTRELQQAVAELDDFTRMISHDLRGPLNGLAGLSGLIRRGLDGGDTEQLPRWLGMMETQTRRLASLVGELLTLARAGSGALLQRTTPLAEVAREALDALALAGGAQRAAQVRLGELPTLAVDTALLRQALVNLFDNALKFTRDTPAPRIDLGAERRGEEWVFSVRDNGIGFDPARAAELFKPFARLHDASFVGSGVGLMIVQRVVERHGGRVWAESRPGEGAAFHFTLPAALTQPGG